MQEQLPLETVLTVLETALGRGDLASEVRAAIGSLGRTPTAADVATAQGYIQARLRGDAEELSFDPGPAVAVVASVVPSAATEWVPTVEEAGTPTSDSSLMGAFGAFIEDLPTGMGLIDAVSDIVRATTLDALVQAVERVFVGALGYDSDRAVDTSRVSARGTVTDWVRVAKFGDFRISVARYPHAMSPHGALYTLFRVHPRGVVFVLYPSLGKTWLGWHSSDAQDPYRARVVRGRGRIRDREETVVTLARRLALLRPRLGEQEDALTLRAEAALERGARELEAEWRVRDPEPGRGLRWSDVSTTMAALFVGGGESGASGAKAAVWGVERVLMDYFPLRVAKRAGDLRCVGWSSERVPVWRQGSLVVDVQLQLELDDAQAQMTYALEVAACVPACDEHGRWWLEGSPYAFRAFWDERGAPRIDALAAEDAEDEADELLMTLIPEADGSTASVAESEDEDDADADTLAGDDEEVWSGGNAEAMSLRGLLEEAMAKRLSALAVRLWRIDLETPDTVAVPLRNLVRAEFIAAVGREGRLLLVSKRHLKAQLTLVDRRPGLRQRLHVLKALNGAAEERLPAWACPELARDLGPGVAVPVACARVSTTGLLFVPDGGSLTVGTATAWEVNPRFGSDRAQELAHWIAPGLEPWARLPVGCLRGAARIAAKGVPLASLAGTSAKRNIEGLVVHGAGLRVCLNEEMFARRRHRDEVLVATVPAPADVVLAGVGDTLGPGDAWMSANRGAWIRVAGEPTRRRPVQDLWERAIDVSFRSEARRYFRVPPGVAGIVTAAETTVTQHRGVSFTVEVRLVIRVTTALDGAVVMADGRAAPLTWVAATEMPFSADGRALDFFISLPDAPPEGPIDQVYFDGRTGELIEDFAAVSGALRCVCVGAGVTGPDPSLRRALRDGRGIPASPRAPSISTEEMLQLFVVDPEAYVRWLRRDARPYHGAPSWLAGVDALAEMLVPSRLAATELSHPDEQRKRRVRPQMRSMALSGRDSASLGLGHARASWNGRADRLCRRAGNRAQHGCAICGRVDAVYCGEGASPRPPVDVFHLGELTPNPWTLHAGAALCGLSSEAYLHRYANEGPDDLLTEQLVALQGARDLVAEVLACRKPESVDERRELIHAVRELRRLKLDRPMDESRVDHALLALWVERVPLPSQALVPIGRVEEAPAMVTSPLSASFFRCVEAEYRRRTMARQGETTCLELARMQVHWAISDYWGPLDASVATTEPKDLATLLARLWPTTRPPRLRTASHLFFAVDGRVLGPRDERGPSHVVARVAVLDPEVAQDVAENLEPSPAVGVDVAYEPDPLMTRVYGVDEKGAYLIAGAVSGAVTADVRDPTTWREACATKALRTRLLPHLIAILASLEAAPTASTLGERGGDAILRWRSGRVPAAGCFRALGRLVPDATAVGWAALGVLMRSLGAASHPSVLVELFDTKLPRNLAVDPERACAELSRVVDAAFPGDVDELVEARALLVRVLGGWWRLPLSAGGQWLWQPPWRARPKPHAQRMVPGLNSRAWRSWPWFDAVVLPVHFATRVRFAARRAWPQALRALFGLDAVGAPRYERAMVHESAVPPLFSFLNAVPEQLGPSAPRGIVRAREAPPKPPPVAVRRDDSLGEALGEVTLYVGPVAEWLRRGGGA